MASIPSEIRCFDSGAHISHQAGLHFPGSVLQHPHVVTGVKDPISLCDVVEGTFVPM